MKPNRTTRVNGNKNESTKNKMAHQFSRRDFEMLAFENEINISNVLIGSSNFKNWHPIQF